MGGSERDAIEIIGYVLVNVGLGRVICRAAGLMSTFRAIVDFATHISGIMAIQGGLAAIIRYLTSQLAKLRTKPKLFIIVGVVLAVLVALGKLLSAVGNLLEKIGHLDELIGLVQLSCTQVHRATAALNGVIPHQFEVIKWL